MHLQQDRIQRHPLPRPREGRPGVFAHGVPFPCEPITSVHRQESGRDTGRVDPGLGAECAGAWSCRGAGRGESVWTSVHPLGCRAAAGPPGGQAAHRQGRPRDADGPEAEADREGARRDRRKPGLRGGNLAPHRLSRGAAGTRQRVLGAGLGAGPPGWPRPQRSASGVGCLFLLLLCPLVLVFPRGLGNRCSVRGNTLLGRGRRGPLKI